MAVDERHEGQGRRRRGERRRPLLARLLSALREDQTGRPSEDDGVGGTAKEVAAELVDQAEAFATLRVADVMTPRADISGLELQTPLVEIIGQFAEVEHTRMPVYRETLDDPVGVAHIKDVFKLIAPSAGRPDGPDAPAWHEAVLHRIKRQVLYIPASMRAADLLVRMRAARIHMAMVIDEYGGVDGLVTMEDLLEAVVGDIDDEHDEETRAAIVVRGGGVLEADARAPLEDLDDRLSLQLTPPDEDEEIDTVGGLVVALAGRVPQRGEVIVHSSGYEFEILEADPRRIRRVRIRPPSAGAHDEGPAAKASAG